jgi:hypothetical protein
MAEVVGFELKFYQKLENGRKSQIKVETVERLAKPFGLEVWHILAPELAGAGVKIPRARSRSVRGPRVK